MRAIQEGPCRPQKLILNLCGIELKLITFFSMAEIAVAYMSVGIACPLPLPEIDLHFQVYIKVRFFSEMSNSAE